MTDLTLGTSAIRQLDGLYSLNDLHAAAGGEAKNQPALFMRNDQTQALIAEIHSTDSQSASKTINGGPNRGTYVCRELVYAYAMWISPKFNLQVIRAFDALHAAPPTPPKQPKLPRRPYPGGLLDEEVAFIRAYIRKFVPEGQRQKAIKNLCEVFRVNDIRQIRAEEMDQVRSHLWAQAHCPSVLLNGDSHESLNAILAVTKNRFLLEFDQYQIPQVRMLDPSEGIVSPATVRDYLHNRRGAFTMKRLLALLREIQEMIEHLSESPPDAEMAELIDIFGPDAFLPNGDFNMESGEWVDAKWYE